MPEKAQTGKDRLLRYFFVALFSLCTVLTVTDSWAQTFNESRWAQETTDAGEFLSNLANIIMYGLLAISFCAGTGLIVWGFVTMANRDGNPQGAQGAWKKVAFGGCLVSTSAILGIIKATMTASAG
jgi:nitrate reductase NapE component